MDKSKNFKPIDDQNKINRPITNEQVCATLLCRHACEHQSRGTAGLLVSK